MKIKKIKNVKKLFRSNVFMVVFILIILFVGVLTLFKVFYSKSTVVYIKVKVGQGLWWTNTNKPNIWFVDSVKKGEKEYNLVGSPTAEIIDVRYYPYFYGVDSESQFFTDQYNMYLTLKIRANYDSKNNKYMFKRSPVLVGTPISFEFPSANITGTIIEISKNGFNNKYVYKTIEIVQKNGYKKSLPYSFASITPGDYYFDGADKVFEIVDKRIEPGILSVSDLNAQVYEREIVSEQNIIIKAKILVKEKDDQYVFAEEQAISVGASYNIKTEKSILTNYIISQIE